MIDAQDGGVERQARGHSNVCVDARVPGDTDNHDRHAEVKDGQREKDEVRRSTKDRKAGAHWQIKGENRDREREIDVEPGEHVQLGGPFVIHTTTSTSSRRLCPHLFHKHTWPVNYGRFGVVARGAGLQ